VHPGNRDLAPQNRRSRLIRGQPGSFGRGASLSETDYAENVDDDAIRALLSRLARPNASGGKTIERAALLAAGVDFTQVIAWIDAHDGKPEDLATASVGRGLHGSRINAGGPQRTPLRYVLPASAFA
jgi:hypothetical protein